MVPGKLAGGQSQFAVIPWTRAAVAEPEAELVVVCGSGREEPAIVVRAGRELSEVESVTVPVRRRDQGPDGFEGE